MFVHLHCHSPYSFLNGVSSTEALVAQAALYQMPALALTDHNTIAGLPEFHKWAAVYGIKPISGAELTLADGTHLTVLAETRQGYRNLCELLTLAHAGEGRRRTPYIEEEILFRLGDGLLVLSGGRHSRIQQLLHRRDEVMAYVYEKYGRDKVARVATYQTFRGRSAVREIGAALALPTPLLDTLAKRVPWSAHADESGCAHR
ncbi:hypothetical protein AAC03nite_14160 [Alicyclobacillus acidoterrestris]|uniref:PHP domain-containing protein n=1 Tax=Alicyclobacillus suci TaxID=2816080 RepID=UPI001195F777|nr:PHP domain-containing protein [Alicyclobacillus suci]GEO25631.1 hypothetical protein AAC03nite_14160 [Alicyclobacillus acidoterrestris]